MSEWNQVQTWGWCRVATVFSIITILEPFLQDDESILVYDLIHLEKLGQSGKAALKVVGHR